MGRIRTCFSIPPLLTHVYAMLGTGPRASRSCWGSGKQGTDRPAQHRYRYMNYHCSATCTVAGFLLPCCDCVLCCEVDWVFAVWGSGLATGVRAAMQCRPHEVEAALRLFGLRVCPPSGSVSCRDFCRENLSPSFLVRCRPTITPSLSFLSSFLLTFSLLQPEPYTPVVGTGMRALCSYR
jgi:hypothetical protein